MRFLPPSLRLWLPLQTLGSSLPVNIATSPYVSYVDDAYRNRRPDSTAMDTGSAHETAAAALESRDDLRLGLRGHDLLSQPYFNECAESASVDNTDTTTESRSLSA